MTLKEAMEPHFNLALSGSTIHQNKLMESPIRDRSSEIQGKMSNGMG